MNCQLNVHPYPIQSHYKEVPRWEIFMEQELSFGLDLGQMANLETVLMEDLIRFK